MQLIVTTPLQIILVDLLQKKLSVLRTGDGYYFGISHSRATIVLNSSKFLLYFPRGKKSQCAGIHLAQPHQIEWVENRVLVADTGNNCVSVFDDQANFINRIFFNEIRRDDKDRGRQGNHFNSVHRVNEKVYVVAHNYEKPSEVWVLSWPDLDILDRIITKAAWAHNVWEGEYGLVICDSKHGGLLDVYSGETIWRADDPSAFTRGLAVSKEHIFVGCSVYQERKERYWKSGKLWVLDRKTLQLVDEMPLPGSGDVQEIRLIGQVDACHNSEVIDIEDLVAIRRKSPLIQAAFHLRQKYPTLQREVFPLSPLVRGIQFFPRWGKNIRTGFRTRFHDQPD